MEKLHGLFFAFIITAIVAQPSDLEDWNAYKLKYSKNYANKIEEELHKEIFLKNKHKIDEHNEQFAKGSVTYKMGLNAFSDSSDTHRSSFLMKKDEFGLSDFFKGGNPKSVWNTCYNWFYGSQHKHNSTHHLPDSIDWRVEGAVSAFVPDQTGCGACSIFSAVAAIEGQYFRKTGKLVELSQQNVIDCSDECTCKGCWPSSVYKYPYLHKQGVCKYKSNSSDVKISQCWRTPRGDENALKEELATIGPLSTSFDTEPDFFDYHSGVYYNPNCSKSTFTHSILLVGYGTENGQDYYLAKNWWTDKWGDKGYFKIARNRDNQCGLATEITFPVL